MANFQGRLWPVSSLPDNETGPTGPTGSASPAVAAVVAPAPRGRWRLLGHRSPVLLPGDRRGRPAQRTRWPSARAKKELHAERNSCFVYRLLLFTNILKCNISLNFPFLFFCRGVCTRAHGEEHNDEKLLCLSCQAVVAGKKMQ